MNTLDTLRPNGRSREMLRRRFHLVAILSLLALGLLAFAGLAAEAGAAGPDVTVLKKAEKEVINPGDPMAFTIEVTNNDKEPVTEVEIKDELPGGKDLSWNWSAPEGVDCKITQDPNTGRWTLECTYKKQLDQGRGIQVIVSTKQSEKECSSYENTATVKAAAKSGTAEVNSNTATIKCSGAPGSGLEVTKKAETELITPGDPMVFRIEVTNNGKEPAAEMVITDELPGGKEINWSWSASEGVDCKITQDPNTGRSTIKCDYKQLEQGKTIKVTVSTKQTEKDCVSYENVAAVSAKGKIAGEIKAESNVATVKCAGSEGPIIDVAKKAEKEVIESGGPMTFTIDVTNGGTDPIAKLAIRDPLPGGTGLDWFFTPEGQCRIETEREAGTRVLYCDFERLEPGKTVTVSVGTGQTGKDCSSYSNTAVVDAADRTERHTVKETNKVTVTCKAPTPPDPPDPPEPPVPPVPPEPPVPPKPPKPAPKPKLQLRVKADHRVVTPGQRVRYTVSIRNRKKGSVAKNLTVCDRIPARMAVVNRGKGRISRGRICWPVKRLPGPATGTRAALAGVGGWVSFHYTARVARNARRGATLTTVADLEELRARWTVRVKLPPEPKPDRATPVTG